jgi:hypothetical protein
MNYYDVYGKELSDDIKNKYLELIKILNNEENIILLFRGDKIKNISKKLKIDIDDIQEISKKIFKIGEKSKSYLNHSLDINNVNNSVFETIFDRINKYFVDDATLEENIEKEFVKYFLEQTNKKIFLENISKIDNNLIKIFVRDYYNFLIHTTDKYKDESGFISTTKEYDIVKNSFTCESSLIFNYFIVEPFFAQAVSANFIKEHNEIIQYYKLPIYGSKGIYPDEKEVSIKAALFPQFILSIGFLKEEKIIINPHIDFDNMEEILRFGICFDQSDFNLEILTTEYKKSVEKTDSNYKDKSI